MLDTKITEAIRGWQLVLLSISMEKPEARLETLALIQQMQSVLGARGLLAVEETKH